MRIEDLDVGRVRPGIEARQLSDLRAIGIDWDGALVRQSERLPVYAEAIGRLEAAGHVYPCYCTRAEIRLAASAPHGPQAAYPGTCRRLTAAERAEREAGGRSPALRIDAAGADVRFEDDLLGPAGGAVDDFVIRRNDGAPAYNLAVIVDDAAQGIGQVVRGADLVDSTPRQVHLAGLLGLRPPRYAHVPLMLGPDGARLAKRHGAVTLGDRLARGESAAAVRSFLAATVGLAEPGEEVTAAELVRRFDPARLPVVPTVLQESAPAW